MLASREQLERYLRTAPAVGRSAALDEDLLDDVLAAASSRLVQACPDRTLDVRPALAGDPLGDNADAETRYFDLGSTGSRVVQVPDLRVLEAAEVDGAAIDAATVRLRRSPGELCALWVRLPYRRAGELALTGRWGPAAARVGTDVADLDVDPAIREACIVWAARAYWNRAARFADNVQDPGGGNVLGYFRNLPPDVKVVVESLTVPGL